MSFDRINIEIDHEIAPQPRLIIFFGHYDLRIYVNDRAYFDVGAGSLGAFLQINFIDEEAATTGCLGSIGRWCEFATTCEVMSQGEHDHDSPINISLRSLSSLAPFAQGLGMKPGGPVSIGNGVVVSSGARVLTGVALGDGCVVGAGAIVTKDVDAFDIVVGNPARVMRRRPGMQPWWDFHPSYMLANAERIQDVAKSAGPHVWRENRPRFVFRRKGGEFTLLGFSDNDSVRPIHEASPIVRAYVGQALATLAEVNGVYLWMADCWAE